MERIEELTLINNAYYLYLKENDKGFQYELFDKENKARVCDGMFCWSDLEDLPIVNPLAAARHYAITDIGIEVNKVVKESLGKCEWLAIDLMKRNSGNNRSSVLADLRHRNRQIIPNCHRSECEEVL